jgi:hypothetical protein
MTALRQKTLNIKKRSMYQIMEWRVKNGLCITIDYYRLLQTVTCFGGVAAPHMMGTWIVVTNNETEVSTIPPFALSQASSGRPRWTSG